MVFSEQHYVTCWWRIVEWKWSQKDKKFLSYVILLSQEVILVSTAKKKYKYKGEKVNVSKNQKNNVPFRTKNLTTGNEKIQQQNVS